MTMNIGLILLAAGSSSRMGQPKQLLKINRETLLHHAATVAMESAIGPVVVVLGANEAPHRKVLEGLDVEVVPNPGWETGMGSSLKAGLRHSLKHRPDTGAVLVMVCDQPLVTAIHLKQLVKSFANSHQEIAASFYSGTSGVPAIFHKELFAEILLMPDATGAKKIISDHPELTHTIALPEGAFDVDTPEDYSRLL